MTIPSLTLRPRARADRTVHDGRPLPTPAGEEDDVLGAPISVGRDTAEALASLGLEPTAPCAPPWTLDDTADRLTIVTDETHTMSDRQVDRLERELANAYEQVQTEALLRRAAELELERIHEETTGWVAEMEARLVALTAEATRAAAETAPSDASPTAWPVATPQAAHEPVPPGRTR